jgi:hypothetical protein
MAKFDISRVKPLLLPTVGAGVGALADGIYPPSGLVLGLASGTALAYGAAKPNSDAFGVLAGSAIWGAGQVVEALNRGIRSGVGGVGAPRLRALVGATHATVKEGSSGADVSAWQDLLENAGYSVAPDPDGTFGDGTDTATRQWQGAQGLVADGIVGPASWSQMTGELPPVSAAAAQSHIEGRRVLLAVWPEVTGENPTISELQIAGGQARLESNYGRSSYVNKVTGQTSGVINNWGAVQAGKPPCGSNFEASDTHADGSAYTWCYKAYATPEDGARDFVKNITLSRPTSWALMKSGDIDAWAAQMHTTDPISHVGLYFEADPSKYAATVAKNAKEIASSLNETLQAVRGGPYEGPSDEETVQGLGLGALGLGLTAAGAFGLAYAAGFKPAVDLVRGATKLFR